MNSREQFRRTIFTREHHPLHTYLCNPDVLNEVGTDHKTATNGPWDQQGERLFLSVTLTPPITKQFSEVLVGPTVSAVDVNLDEDIE